MNVAVASSTPDQWLIKEKLDYAGRGVRNL